jgi:hypothetical protein
VEAERGAASWRVEAERGAAREWTVEAENLKWANGKGESKIWYLYLGFVRAF